jgi:hypothetical protein
MRAWQRRAAGVVVAGAAAVLWGCGDDSGKPVALKNPPGVATAPAVNVTATPGADPSGPVGARAKVDVTQLGPILPLGGDQVAARMADGQMWAKFPNGMAYQDIKNGVSAQPSPGQTVYIFYTAKVARTGEIFAQSEKGKPTAFLLGSTKLPSGLNTAIYNTQRGAKRRWWIPPELAFGEKGLPPLVGPNEAVIYTIEIQQWEGEPVNVPSLNVTEMGPPAAYAPKPAPGKAEPTTGPAGPVGPAAQP